MRELFDGVHHWTAVRETIGWRVSSYWVQPAGVVVDPLVPEEGLDAFEALELVVLTTGLHSRHAQRFADAFGIPIRAPREAAARLGDSLAFEPYDDGEQLAPGVHAVRVGALCPDEYALHVTVTEGAVVLADALMHYDDALEFVPVSLMGDDPAAVQDGLHARLRELADRTWDHLLPTHGEPIVGGGREALRALLGA